MSQKKLFSIIAVACGGVGFLLSFIFTIVSCNASADNLLKDLMKGKDPHGSYFFILVLLGAIIAIAGAVFAFLSREAGTGVWNGFDIFAITAFALCVVTLLFAIFPHVTICAYNCKLNTK